MRRHIFRQAVQEQGESVDSFVSKLKQLAVTCDFGDHKDDFIRDQVIDKCTSTALRRRLLRDKDLTLFMLQDIARTMEAVDQQAAKMQLMLVIRVPTQFGDIPISSPTWRTTRHLSCPPEFHRWWGWGIAHAQQLH